MATFEAKVYRLKIEPHPNADKLELAAVGDYRAVVGKGLYKTGDYGVYIQEGSIVPDWLCKKYEWKLAGPQANRVKAIKLRGVLSQGIIVPLRNGSIDDPDWIYPDGCDGHLTLEDGSEVDVELGEDVAELLGITKYEPPIPVHMAGEVANAHGYTLSYDIENIKKYPDIIEQDELVVMTEKLHGTWTCLGYNVNYGDIVTSKGMSGQGLVFKFNDANKDNLYMRSLKSTEKKIPLGFDHDSGEELYDVQNVIVRAYELFSAMHSFYILGETFGKGVQDLHYGTTEPQFRAFDIYIGEPGQGEYLPAAKFFEVCKALDLPTVPVLYLGPYSKEKLLEFTNGTETFSGKGANIREGVVVKPVVERRHPEIGRVQLKSVSEAYLLRKGDVTELT